MAKAKKGKRYRVTLTSTLETGSLKLIQSRLDEMEFDEDVLAKAMIGQPEVVMQITKEGRNRMVTRLKIEIIES